VLAGRRLEEGKSVAEEINSAGGEAVFVQTDVTKEDQVKHLVDETLRHFGRLDIAFNNAGIEQLGSVTDFTEADYRKVFDINVLGVFLSQKYEIPAMLKSGGGSIINTSSIVGHMLECREQASTSHRNTPLKGLPRQRHSKWRSGYSSECRGSRCHRHRHDRSVCRC
jgi:NAD(P)-dependent dehydrogenase (short-subunit alcohol dehydrogenase family)